MSHHASGPNFGFPRGDARLDMTDLYAFTKPGDPAKSIIDLQCAPVFQPWTRRSRRRRSPSRQERCTKSRSTPTAMPLPISVTACSSHLPKMESRLRQFAVLRVREPPGSCDDGEVIVEGAPVSVGREALVTKAGDYRFFFGWRSDPFFFDVNGQFQSTCSSQATISSQTKMFAASCLNCPTRLWEPMRWGFGLAQWTKTGEGWVQADRGGRPLQAVFLPGEQREAYLSGEPANDDRFIGVFAHELEHSGGYTPEDAIRRREKVAARHSFL